jgi:hypothetical protein
MDDQERKDMAAAVRLTFEARRDRELMRNERALRASLGAWEQIALAYERRGEKYPATKTVALRSLMNRYHAMQVEMHEALRELKDLMKEGEGDGQA